MESKERSKTTGLVVSAVLSLTACLSGVALYTEWNGISEEISDDAPVSGLTGQGYAGFEFVNAVKTWEQAKQICRENGMVLATADTADKIDRIHAVAGGRRVWVGYRAPDGEQGNSGAYKWESGAPTAFARWQPGEPNNDARWPNEFCTELMANKNMNNLNCDDESRHFVCDKSPYIDSYAMHGVNGAGYTWDQASEQCRIRYGTSLATLGEGERMAQMMQAWQWPRAWIGLRITPGIPFSEQNFRYSSGVARRFALKWAPNEPNNWGPGEHCAEIQNNEGMLNDMPCHSRLRNYICDLFVGNRGFLERSYTHMTERAARQGYLAPANMIDVRGRRRSLFRSAIKIRGVTPLWSNVFHIGNADTIRSPGLWQYPRNMRRLHFRQAAINSWNEGCDPAEQFLGELNQWFRIEVMAQPGSYMIRINGVLRCMRRITINPPVGGQRVWISDPWRRAAPVTLADTFFFAF